MYTTHTHFLLYGHSRSKLTEDHRHTHAAICFDLHWALAHAHSRTNAQTQMYEGFLHLVYLLYSLPEGCETVTLHARKWQYSKGDHHVWALHWAGPRQRSEKRASDESADKPEVCLSGLADRPSYVLLWPGVLVSIQKLRCFGRISVSSSTSLIFIDVESLDYANIFPTCFTIPIVHPDSAVIRGNAVGSKHLIPLACADCAVNCGSAVDSEPLIPLAYADSAAICIHSQFSSVH